MILWGRGWGREGKGISISTMQKGAILQKCVNTFVPHCSFHKKKKLVLQMVALDLNLPVKHAGLVPIRLPVILGKLINKTLTTDNWHREHGRSTEAKQKEKLLQLVDLDLNPPNKHAGLVPVRLPVRLGEPN